MVASIGLMPTVPMHQALPALRQALYVRQATASRANCCGRPSALLCAIHITKEYTPTRTSVSCR